MNVRKGRNKREFAVFVLQIAQGRKVRLREKCLLVQGALTKQYVHQAPPGRQIRVSRDC